MLSSGHGSAPATYNAVGHLGVHSVKHHNGSVPPVANQTNTAVVPSAIQQLNAESLSPLAQQPVAQAPDFFTSDSLTVLLNTYFSIDGFGGNNWY
ncbi:MAG TPA: hypothetical protein PLV25_06495 [Opitutales bacterium]|nr:hypothetical protein [Opitutales bacterium]